LSAARERRRLEKLKEIASSRKRRPPPIPLTLSPSPIIKEPILSTPNSNTSDYDEPDTYLHKACVSQFDLTYDMADYFKNLYGNRIKINEDSCEKINFPKNIYKSIKIDINVFPTNRDGLNILPEKYVYGVNLETNTGCILEKTNTPSEINTNLVPLGHILDNLPQGDGGGILPEGYIWGFSRIGVIPIYTGKVSTKKHILKPTVVKPKVKTSSNTKIEKEKDGRLRARYYYDTYGRDKTVGDRCNTRKDGKYSCLLKRKDNNPYWASPSKSGKGQEKCNDWTERCKDKDYS
jgi:hypothetical protein